MAVFAIVLNGSNDEIVQNIEREFSETERYEIEGTSVTLVSSSLLTSGIAKKIGLQGDDRVEDARGVVLRIGSYSGWNTRSLWEWLKVQEGD